MRLDAPALVTLAKQVARDFLPVKVKSDLGQILSVRENRGDGTLARLAVADCRAHDAILSVRMTADVLSSEDALVRALLTSAVTYGESSNGGSGTYASLGGVQRLGSSRVAALRGLLDLLLSPEALVDGRSEVAVPDRFENWAEGQNGLMRGSAAWTFAAAAWRAAKEPEESEDEEQSA